jgi:hypothetical protein
MQNQKDKTPKMKELTPTGSLVALPDELLLEIVGRLDSSSLFAMCKAYTGFERLASLELIENKMTEEMQLEFADELHVFKKLNSTNTWKLLID